MSSQVVLDCLCMILWLVRADEIGLGGSNSKRKSEQGMGHILEDKLVRVRSRSRGNFHIGSSLKTCK